MNNADEEKSWLLKAYAIRRFEERLLELFRAGKLSGTTHTCIGQEFSALALAAPLQPGDAVFSSHRCHGHYIARTGDMEGLMAEVMGKRSGTCAGLGGSQHLCRDGFFSSGVQGGIAPVAAGVAWAQKLKDAGEICVVILGDGTLGEGAVYEAFNIASKWELPLLFALENNLYAQSTPQSQTLAGSIAARAEAFAIPAHRGDTWDWRGLMSLAARVSGTVRRQRRPAFLQVDTYRLAPHSKGDDDRAASEIRAHEERDPLNIFLKSESAAQLASELQAVDACLEQAVRRASEDTFLSFQPPVESAPSRPRRRAVAGEGEIQTRAIHRALAAQLESEPRALFFGEDVEHPYGGAFKIAKDLSARFPGRVRNGPISEAGLVGVGTGLAIKGLRPVVEIMFGDFLTLAADQLLNHAAKFEFMYSRQVQVPLVLRTPMGGGRGYGATHSQCLEKHFAGIPGMDLYVLHGRARAFEFYRRLFRDVRRPALVIEHKLLYAFTGNEPLPAGLEQFETDEAAPMTLLRPAQGPADLTLVVFGAMSAPAEEAARRLLAEEEIIVEIILPLRVSPFDVGPVLESVERTRRVVVVEEGAAGFNLGCEVLAQLARHWKDERAFRARALSAAPCALPSSLALEKKVLPGTERIFTACVEVFSE